MRLGQVSFVVSWTLPDWVLETRSVVSLRLVRWGNGSRRGWIVLATSLASAAERELRSPEGMAVR